ncbi:heavy-metal-associated domain-containing protein [Maribellus maritimus]|uniref:heavy-metal-associated domain-containing protein n=1 Tax=Maribellus maritimus TaxID=2870838 RepID=UPI001EEA3EE5|nr:heavy-metal-associated domain-containing protein [Maribellus maritimus]MCG6188820.1 heavy-metal-associated domain-containing protein [Maribellus maritimus]
MEKIVLKTDLSCKHCVMKVEPVLKNEAGIIDYSVDLEHPDKLVTISSEGSNIDSVIAGFKKAGYSAEKI